MLVHENSVHGNSKGHFVTDRPHQIISVKLFWCTPLKCFQRAFLAPLQGAVCPARCFCQGRANETLRGYRAHLSLLSSCTLCANQPDELGTTAEVGYSGLINNAIKDDQLHPPLRNEVQKHTRKRLPGDSTLPWCNQIPLKTKNSLRSQGRFSHDQILQEQTVLRLSGLHGSTVKFTQALEIQYQCIYV